MSEGLFEKNKELNFEVVTEFEVAKQSFNAVLANVEEGIILGATWNNSDKTEFALKDFFKHFGLDLPDLLNFSLSIDSVGLQYGFKSEQFKFKVLLNDSILVIAKSFVENDERCFLFNMHIDKTMSFSNIPVLGSMLSGEDGIKIESIELKKNNHKISATIKAMLSFGSFNLPLEFEVDNNDHANSVSSAKWVDVHKSFKIVTINRLGVSFVDGRITIFIDASFMLSVLKLDFYEMYLSTVVPPKKKEFGFGLSGLMVTFNKPPLTLGGGLYKNTTIENCPILYDGQLQVGFGKFNLTALGSYGELENRDRTLFIYLMVKYPLGGPSFFFVTGLAAGFGINRKFMLPELKEVEKFPLVALARNKSTSISEKSKPTEVLNTLSTHLVPSSGDYFVTVGIAFRSFNMFNSFALLTVAFGNNLQVSLLGISEVSLPPNTPSSDNPIAYAQLVLKAVYDYNEGSMKIDAMLTEESYLLDKKCKLTGGFAFYVWGKGDHKGDFVVTLGGLRHPKYEKPAHYPTVDKLGINWKISDELSVTGNAYFGLTPACLMAGGGLSILYESGRIGAWLIAQVDMLIQWKPFYYDIRIYVALGAKYRGILATYKIQMSADLQIWGPNFSGKMRIEWFIISFTIRFGKDASKPKALDYNDFYESFIPKEIPMQTGTKSLIQSNANSKRLLSVQITSGIIDEKKSKNVMMVDSSTLSFETHSEMPATILATVKNDIFSYKETLGIVPMEIKKYTSTHQVKIWYSSNPDIDISNEFVITEILENVSSGLWLNDVPTLSSKLIKDVPVGLRFAIREEKITGDRLPTLKRYRLATLEKHESIGFTISWHNLKPQMSKVKNEKAFETINNSMKKLMSKTDLISELSGSFKLKNKVKIKDIGLRSENFFFDTPIICNTGSVIKEGGNNDG